MMLNSVNALLALGAGPTPPGTTPDPTGEMIKLVGMMAIMGLMFYFVILRPQRSRQKQQEALLKAVKAGDKILTNSGIVAVVITVKEKSLSIRSADSKLEILKSAVAEITERAGESSPS
jgi:preprotein translocase subunit YajC